MRVLVLDQAAGVWGAQHYLLRLAPVLRERGVDLVLGSSAGSELATEWRRRGLPWTEIDLPETRSVRAGGDTSRPDPRSVLRELAVLLRSARAIARAARAVGADAVHANGHAVHLDAALAGRFARIPVLLVLHEEMTQGFGRLLRVSACLAARRTVAVSNAVAAGLPSLARGRVTVVPNGVDTDRFAPGPPSAAVRESLGARADQVLLVALTRLDPEKRIEDLVAAVAPLAGRDDWHLAVVGQTSRHPAYEQQVRALATTLPGRVTFTGPRTDTDDVLRAADVLVHTGVVEGMPLGVIEAQAVGRPVVAYRVAGVPEVVRDGVTGLLAPPLDTAGVTRHLSVLLDDPARRADLGRAAAERVTNEFSLQRQGERHRDVLGALAPRRARADARPRRMLLVNHWHDDNRGDSAITQGVLLAVEHSFPGCDVTIASLSEGRLWEGSTRHIRRLLPEVRSVPSPVPTELRGNDAARTRVRIAVDTAVWAARALPLVLTVAGVPVPSRLRRLVADHDVVVLLGGSNLFDDARVPRVISVLRLFGVLAPAAVGARLGRRVVLLGHTLGPFARPESRFAVRRLLRGADAIVVREATSVEVGRSLRLPNVDEAPDMAFAVAPVDTDTVERAFASLPCAPERTVALSIRQHPTLGSDADDRLLGVFAAAAARLVEGGWCDAVVVVPHTVGPTPVEDDRPISRELLARLDGTPAVLVDDDFSAGELAAFYGRLGGVVAVRLHAAILALASGTPTYAVSYLTAKTQGVMSQVGLPDAVGDFATVTTEEIVSGLSAQLADPSLRTRIADESAVRRETLLKRAVGWLG